ncbi:uncharacterized protein LOC107780872 [Nicotiana tabacum]|uniref:Uncharacterized protein LOC107780872 n=2 Tax=Nicotiana TaxID=4085 RepID=A0A1S3YYP3_TOBAC|nr:PREDICTED: uncharacterized protein LOC104215342 isoform X2 [Nicotiana sylvestris]XP_016456962.1 PREDICTED: uncharacterized protein LOC107780872 [Nicotiana tabacum]
MMDIHVECTPRKMEECRICHDADEDSNMEIPCSCRGTLKYAHRKCVQRWCNEKGDTVCEICRQNFKPNYTAPAPVFGRFPMNMRGNWEISMNSLDYPQFVALASADHNFLDYDFDEYSVFYPTSLICCRMVAITFVLLLMLRTILPLILSVAGDNSITLIMLSVLKTVGILLAVYALAKVFLAIRHRRHQQDLHHSQITPSDEETELPLQQHPHSQIAPLDDENELPLQPPRPHFIHVQ